MSGGERARKVLAKAEFPGGDEITVLEEPCGKMTVLITTSENVQLVYPGWSGAGEKVVDRMESFFEERKRIKVN